MGKIRQDEYQDKNISQFQDLSWTIFNFKPKNQVENQAKNQYETMNAMQADATNAR